MSTSIAGRVSSLIEDVTKVELGSEGAYLSFGRLLPSIAEEMERSSRKSSEALAGFSSITGSSSDSGLKRMEDFARESSAFFASVHERDGAFLARINDSIERLGSLEDVIGRVRSDSEEMEIISLNAMTVALKSGNAGKAFSVITDELKRLSTRTISLTETITARGRDLMECFSGLRDSLRGLDSFQDGFFANLDRTLNAGFAELESGTREAMGTFGGLLEEARGVATPVQAVMQGIQLQDIIRQSLQHVTISLREARKAAMDAESHPGEAAPGRATLTQSLRSGALSATAAFEGEDLLEGVDSDEELAFVAAIAELAHALLDDAVEKLESSGRAFSDNLGSVGAIVDGVEAKRRAFIQSLGEGAAGARADAASFSRDSATYLSLKKGVIQTARRLAEQVKGLDESFRGLAGLLSRFQNIVIASRIEVAKNRALSGVTNTVQGMVELTERIGSDVNAAMGTTKDFIKVAYTAIADYAGSGEETASDWTDGASRAAASCRDDEGAWSGEGDRLLYTLNRVESDICLLDGLRERVREAISGFLLYTPEFIDLISQARSGISVLTDFAARLRGIQTELLALKEELGKAGGAEEAGSAIKSERLLAMIERFTIFTHKKTAGEIGRFEVEEGIEAGDVTLF
jgi:hypothetical protein